MLSYPSGLQVSTRALTLLTDALRAHRVQLHTQWRALPCGRQALLVLARLRKNEAYPDLAAGFAIGVATVCRYVHEALDLLSVMAPTLADAVQNGRPQGLRGPGRHRGPHRLGVRGLPP